jgi:hypothetical protein
MQPGGKPPAQKRCRSGTVSLARDARPRSFTQPQSAPAGARQARTDKMAKYSRYTGQKNCQAARVRVVAGNDAGFWPQYYLGNGAESDFSRGLGVNSIPTVFLVDQKGEFFSLDAGGKLEALIPELINRMVTTDERAEGRRLPAGP